MGYAMLAAVVLLGLLVVRCETEKRAGNRRAFEKGLAFLASRNGAIYANHRGLFQLDLGSGKWILRVPKVRGYRSQHIVLRDNEIYFAERDRNYNYFIKTQPLKRGAVARVLTKVQGVPNLLALSHDGTKLAYSTRVDSNSAIVLLDLKGGNERWVSCHAVQSILWSSADNYLFLGSSSGIRKLNLDSNSESLVAQAIWLTPLDTNTVVCIGKRDSRMLCFKKDLVTGLETELFEIDERESLYSVAWEADGRYFVTAQIRNTWFISHELKLTIWDIETGERYALPNFGRVTGCILIGQKVTN